MRHLLIPLVLVVTAAACVEQRTEDPPIDTRDNVLLQGVYDCTESTDTGYTNGNPFSITVVNVDGRPVELDTANAYIVMQEAAAADGVDIRIVSGFRTMAQQEYFYSCYVNCNCNNCNLAAAPGESNHQSGHALDLNTSEGGVLSWLNAHGAAFGFARTVSSEPWHWEWWGGGPGGGPCGAAPECLANPSYGGCNGSVITHCDDTNHISSGDCGFFGAACSTANGDPHCVHPYCTQNTPDGENGTFCADDSVVATCTWGAYAEGDCGAFGGTCSDAGGSGHCVHFLCWTNLDGGEDGSFCHQGENGVQRGTCAVGVLALEDCAAGTACTESTATAAACVDPNAPPAEEPPTEEPPIEEPPTGGEEPLAGASSSADRPRRFEPSVEQRGCAQGGAPIAVMMLLGLLKRRRRS